MQLYLRLKPSKLMTPETSYFRLNSTEEIQLLIPPNNRDPYYFTEIFKDPAENALNSLSNTCVASAFSGTNVSVIAIGAKGSGKSRTIFGDDRSKENLCYAVVSQIFEAIRKNSKDKDCSITVSFIDICNDVVRDLGLAYFKKDELGLGEICEILTGQDLEIKEALGRSYVEDACSLQILNPSEVLNVMQVGLEARRRIGSDGDCAFCITLSQRVQNKTQSARVYLVDLSSSSEIDWSEDTPMYCMQKVLNKVNLMNLGVKVSNIPFKSSKIMYLIQGSIVSSNVLVVSHIDTNPQKFKDSQQILKFSKSLTEIDKKIQLTMMVRPNSSRSSEWAKRLKEEIGELHNSIKRNQSYHEEKLRNFAKLIGIEDDLETLVSAEKGSKEFELCRKYREAMQSVKNLTLRNNELELKIENFKKIMNDMQAVHYTNIEKNKRKVQELRDEISDVKEGLEMYDEYKEKTMAEKVMMGTENLEKMFHHSQFVLEEKADTIQKVKGIMESNSSDLKNALDIKDLGRTEIESDFKKQVLDDVHAQKIRIKELEDEYQVLFKTSDKNILNARIEVLQKARNLDATYNDLKQEAVRLFEVARLQGKAIYDIENGKYNKGISPVLIPRSHIPQIPNDSKFPLIFSALGAQSLEVARVSSKVKSQFSYTTSRSISFASRTTTVKEPEKPIEIETGISTLLATDISALKVQDLTSFSTSLQKIIIQNSEKTKEIYQESTAIEQEILKVKADFDQILKEKEKYKIAYADEVKKRLDKEMDRCEGKKTFLTEILSRPGTQRNIYTSDKMMRNIHTTISAHRLPMTGQAYKFDSIRPSTTVHTHFPRRKSEKS